MAVQVDTSSPARWSGTPANNTNLASASFTAPADALLVCCVNNDASTSGGTTNVTVSDTGGLAWTQRVVRTGAEATAGGHASIWTARTTSSVSRQANVQHDPANSSNRISAKLYVITGVDVNGTPVDTVGANNEGGSATNNLTTSSVTPGADGLLIAVGTDWSQLGLPTSSDLTKDAADYTGQISVISGYKASTSGAGITANLDAGGTAAPQWKWCQVTVRGTAGGTPNTLSLSGSLSNTGARVLAAASPRVGAATSAGARMLAAAAGRAGALVPTGIVSRATASSRTGSLAPGGTVGLGRAVLKTGAVTASAAVSRATSAARTGAIASGGAIVRGATLARTGVATLAGPATRAVVHAASGVITSSGVALLGRAWSLSLAGAITFAGALGRAAGRVVSAVLSPAGASTRGVALARASAVVAAGSTARLASTAIVGALAAGGALGRAAGRVGAGVLSLAGLAQMVGPPGPAVAAPYDGFPKSHMRPLA